MKRFVVLTYPRAGSSLLIRGLMQHPALRVHGELFDPRPDDPSRVTPGGRRYAPPEDGAEFLRHVFAPERGEAAAGFKLFHHHAGTPPAATAWDFLRADRELRVLHLRRDDYLRCVVSHHVVERTRVWTAEHAAGRPKPPAPFALDPNECRSDFETLLAWETRARDWFGDRAFLELEYERDLERDVARACTRIFAWLEVPAVPVVPSLVKLAALSPRQQLANYAELAAAFAGGPFARFFDE